VKDDNDDDDNDGDDSDDDDGDDDDGDDDCNDFLESGGIVFIFSLLFLLLQSSTE
jgi:hypothetical protein